MTFSSGQSRQVRVLLQRDGAQTRNCGEEKKRNVLEKVKNKNAGKKKSKLNRLLLLDSTVEG